MVKRKKRKKFKLSKSQSRAFVKVKKQIQELKANKLKKLKELKKLKQLKKLERPKKLKTPKPPKPFPKRLRIIIHSPLHENPPPIRQAIFDINILLSVVSITDKPQIRRILREDYRTDPQRLAYALAVLAHWADVEAVRQEQKAARQKAVPDEIPETPAERAARQVEFNKLRASRGNPPADVGPLRPIPPNESARDRWYRELRAAGGYRIVRWGRPPAGWVPPPPESPESPESPEPSVPPPPEPSEPPPPEVKEG